MWQRSRSSGQILCGHSFL
jgi:hypothetical protein